MKIIPLVVGSCAIPKQFGNRLKEIGVSAETASLENSFIRNGSNIKKDPRNLSLLVVA